MTKIYLLCFFCVTVFSQQATTDASAQLVPLASISVKGTRLAANSIAVLSQLKIGQRIDEKTVREACVRLNNTGLFKNIQYGYESLPDKTDVALVLTVEDERPLLPATIRIPNVEEQQVWDWLQKLDPLFTRELPPTDLALRLYQANINKYLRTLGRDDIMISELTADKQGNASGILFKPGKLRGNAPQKK
jgi:hypothetical protein